MKCFNCLQELKPVFEDINENTVQYENALVINLIGGYGMYVDNKEYSFSREQLEGETSRDKYEIILCKECVDEACSKMPWVQKALMLDENSTNSFKELI